MRLGLVTAEMHLLALVGSVLPFMVCASFVPVDGDSTLICCVVAIPMRTLFLVYISFGKFFELAGTCIEAFFVHLKFQHGGNSIFQKF
eukprot:5803096-Ditylum_brightwellii.AAC.2